MLSICISLTITLVAGTMPALVVWAWDMTQPSLAEQLWRQGVKRDLLRRFP